MSKSASARAAGEVLTHRQTLTVMVGLMLGLFLSSLDQTIVSTSIYTIANDLDGLSLQAWATTAYLITSTVSTPCTANSATSLADARCIWLPLRSSWQGRCMRVRSIP